MNRLGSSLRTLGIPLLVVLTTSGSAFAQGIERSPTLSLGAGWFDFNRQRNQALEAHAEYRVSFDAPRVRALAVAMTTSDSSIFLGAGVGYEYPVGRHWILAPTFTPGYYRNGSGNDLSLPLEFRSQIEFGRRFDRGSRLSIAISHTSNGGFSDHNPGKESLNVICEIPLTGRSPH